MSMVSAMGEALSAWQTLYADSAAVSMTVTVTHILALLLAGGLAIAADRASLRAMRMPAQGRSFHLRELRAVHRPVLIALSLLFVSGLLLTAADPGTFLRSALFWFKMSLIGLLIVNAIHLRRTESKLAAAGGADGHGERLWNRLALQARASMALWILTTIAGTLLINT